MAKILSFCLVFLATCPLMAAGPECRIVEYANDKIVQSVDFKVFPTERTTYEGKYFNLWFRAADHENDLRNFIYVAEAIDLQHPEFRSTGDLVFTSEKSSSEAQVSYQLPQPDWQGVESVRIYFRCAYPKKDWVL